jgi:hypothetical protein
LSDPDSPREPPPFRARGETRNYFIGSCVSPIYKPCERMHNESMKNDKLTGIVTKMAHCEFCCNPIGVTDLPLLIGDARLVHGRCIEKARRVGGIFAAPDRTVREYVVATHEEE